MSNTTPDSGNANHDRDVPPQGDNAETREYEPLAPAVPADSDAVAQDAETRDAARRDSTVAPDAAPVSSEFDPDAFADALPARDDSTPATAAAPAVGDVAHERVHHHTPEIADQAYAEAPDTHVLSSSEPTVLTQADLHADRVRDAESTHDGDTAAAPVYTDSTAPVAPTPPVSERPAPVRQPVYVQAPTEPKPKGNRGFGILVSLLATAVFALLYAGVLALLRVVDGGSVDIVNDVLLGASFWVPVIFFFLGLVLLVSVVNRGGWWAYVIGGFVVAAIVYASYLGGVLIEQAASIRPSEVAGVVQESLFAAPAVLAFVIAREVPIWFGAWVAARGRKVKERNLEARREYERILDQGPVLS